MHVSTNAHKYWRQFGDREGDFKTLAAQLVPRIDPGAVIITGDLTDSKKADGSGLQMEEEWQRYENLLSALTDSGGIPLSSIVDVRGNHDGFNRAPRGSQKDYFFHYSATGRKIKDPSKRVWSHILLPQQHAESELFTDGARVNKSSTRFIPLEEWKLVVDNNDKTSVLPCPGAVFLGIDFSADPGLKNPLNFLGQSDTLLESQIKSERAKIEAFWPHNCPAPPPIVSYGHFPLSTVDHQSQSHGWWTRAGPLSHILHALRPIRNMQGATRTLAESGVGSYLSGHLHLVFGERLHKAHPIFLSNGVDPSLVFAADDIDASTAVLPNSTNTVNINKHRVFNELETGAWKEDRRLRIAAIDGGVLSFVDIYMHTPTAPLKPRRSDAQQRENKEWKQRYKQRGWGLGIAGVADGLILDHVGMMTWPTDARYSPQSATQMNAYPRGTVRALVFSLDEKEKGDESGVEGEEATEDLIVEIQVFYDDDTLLFQAPLNPVVVNNSSEDTGRGPVLLFSGAPSVLLDCKSKGSGDGALQQSNNADCAPPAEFVDVIINVQTKGRALNGDSVPAATFSISKSGRFRVALSCTLTGAQQAQQECWLAPAENTAPMEGIWLESFALYINAAVFFHQGFLATWVVYFIFFLLLPRTLAKDKGIYQRILGSQLRVQGKNRSPSPPLAVSGMAAVKFAITRPLSRVAAVVTWPFSALVLCAGVTRAWLPMILYSLYYLVGPLYFAPLFDGRFSFPLSAVFFFGIVGKFENEASWRFVPTSDTLPVAGGQILIGIVPLTIWVACVVASHVVAANRKKERNSPMEQGGPRLVSIAQTVSFVGIMVFNYVLMYHKMSVFMGPLALLISPGFAWVGPLAVILVATAVRDRPILTVHGYAFDKSE